jgi:hypothetical protein
MSAAASPSRLATRILAVSIVLYAAGAALSRAVAADWSGGDFAGIAARALVTLIATVILVAAFLTTRAVNACVLLVVLWIFVAVGFTAFIWYGVATTPAPGSAGLAVLIVTPIAAGSIILGYPFMLASARRAYPALREAVGVAGPLAMTLVVGGALATPGFLPRPSPERVTVAIVVTLLLSCVAIVVAAIAPRRLAVSPRVGWICLAMALVLDVLVVPSI